jgi:Na+/H+ antiporter NhaC
MTDPSWYSILPPIIAIVLAIWTKQVILSLFAGIWMGPKVSTGSSTSSATLAIPGSCYSHY